MQLADRIATDAHFLSPINPLATAEQRDAEALALEIAASDRFGALRAAAAHRWRSMVGGDPDAEAWARFDGFLDECAFAAILKAINGDPNYPAVVRLVMPPHDWFDMRVPGSRFGGGPGIDQSYAIVPVDHGARYVLHGQWIGRAPADHVHVLAGNPSMTNILAQLTLAQLQVGNDGRFAITIDPDPADGRPNHIQTQPGAQYLFIRDCRSDWRQAATALRVARIDPPTRPRWTRAQITERAGHLLAEDAPAMYAWMRYFLTMAPNSVGVPFGTGALGGLVAQQVAFVHVAIDPGHAFVLHVDPARADFFDIQLNDYWFNSVGDYVGRTASFNKAQSAPGPDGTIRYVVALRDPGVANWLDPNGLRRLFVTQRWQRIPEGRAPTISGALVAVDALDAVLGPDVPRVDAAGRDAQIAERRATYAPRLTDH